MTRTKQNEPDIIMITEALPKNRSVPVQMSELSVDGYDIVSNIPSCNKRCVLIYTRNCMTASPNKAEEICAFEESCWSKIKL